MRLDLGEHVLVSALYFKRHHEIVSRTPLPRTVVEENREAGNELAAH
jgi:hypothetical protein